MICHKKKIIYIHIPKCGGSSLNKFYIHSEQLDWKTPNYDLLYGWCPKRQIHLQHATSKQLLETELVTQEQWDNYFKFTFVRNPWDRSYSDYFWIKKDCKVEGPFRDYLHASNNFEPFLSKKNINSKSYRGDHLQPQMDFFTIDGDYDMDFVGRFEHFQDEVLKLNTILGITEDFHFHEKKNHKKTQHYSFFYNDKRKNMVEDIYNVDINQLEYSFLNKKKENGIFRNMINLFTRH